MSDNAHNHRAAVIELGIARAARPPLRWIVLLAMRFHAPTKAITIPIADIERASFYFLNAIKNIRIASKRPLTPYKQDGALRTDDYAMKSLLDGAAAIGIDLGAEWGNELDVSDAG